MHPHSFAASARRRQTVRRVQPPDVDDSDSYYALKALVPAQAAHPDGFQSGGLAIGTLRPRHSAQAMARHGLEEAIPDDATDLHLLAACRDQDDQEALVCLRCRVSHPAVRALRGFHRRYATSYGLDLLEMAVLVLDDRGDLYPYTSPQVEREAATQAARHEPFLLASVVRTFRPGFCGLPHWTKLRIQACRELKAYLKEHGLLLISDWALLADSTGKRVREAWALYGRGSLQPDQAVALLKAYQPLYRQAKEAFHAASGRSSGWRPSVDFLQQLSREVSTPVRADDLSAVAQAVRSFLVGPRGAFQPFDERSDQLVAANHDAIEELEADQLPAAEQRQLVDAALKRAMDAYLPAVLGSSGTNPALVRCLWQGYGEGLSNRPNAERCGCTPGTVSKKLTPEIHAHRLALSAAQELQRHRAFATIGQSVEATERCVTALKNHLLNPEREGEEAPMRFWIRSYLSRP